MIKRWKKVFWPSNDECSISGSTEANVIKVYLGDMVGIFFVLALGIYLYPCLVLGPNIFPSRMCDFCRDNDCRILHGQMEE